MSDNHWWLSEGTSYIIVNNCFIPRERMRYRGNNSFVKARAGWGKVNYEVGDVCEAAKTELAMLYVLF